MTQEEDVDLLSVTKFVWNARFSILLCVILATAAGVYKALNAPPEYISSSTVLIEPRQYLSVGNSENAARFGVDENLLRSHMSIMMSPDILGRVVDTLGLEQRPDFAVNAANKREAIRELFKVIEVSNIPSTQLLRVEATAADPDLAAALANSVVRSYLLQEQISRRDRATDTVEWLDRRLERLEARVHSSKLAFEQHRAQFSFDLDGEIQNTSSTIERLKKSIGSQSGSEATALSNALTDSQTRLSQLIQANVEIDGLSRNLELDQQMLETFITSRQEFLAFAEFPLDDARVVSEALSPLQASGPNKRLIVLAAAFVGFNAGLFLHGITAIRRRVSGLPAPAKA